MKEIKYFNGREREGRWAKAKEVRCFARAEMLQVDLDKSF